VHPPGKAAGVMSNECFRQFALIASAFNQVSSDNDEAERRFG